MPFSGSVNLTVTWEQLSCHNSARKRKQHTQGYNGFPDAYHVLETGVLKYFSYLATMGQLVVTELLGNVYTPDIIYG